MRVSAGQLRRNIETAVHGKVVIWARSECFGDRYYIRAVRWWVRPPRALLFGSV